METIRYDAVIRIAHYPMNFPLAATEQKMSATAQMNSNILLFRERGLEIIRFRASGPDVSHMSMRFSGCLRRYQQGESPIWGNIELTQVSSRGSSNISSILASLRGMA